MGLRINGKHIGEVTALVVPPSLYARAKADPRYAAACERGDIVPNEALPHAR
jgi:hypothetical protein